LQVLPLQALTKKSLFKKPGESRVFFYNYKMSTPTLDEAIKLFQNGQYALAEQLLHKIPKQKEAGAERRRQVISCALDIRTGRAIEAIKKLQIIIQKFGEDEEAANLIGVALRASNQMQKAYEWLDPAHLKYPKSIDIVHNLAVTATDLGKLAESIEFSEKALQLNPNFVETLKNLGRVYVTKRDAVNSERVFKRLNELQPNSIDVLVGLGAVNLIHDNPFDAAKYFERALEQNQSNGPAWANLGLCYKILGEFTKSRECLMKAIEVDPQQIEHKWNLSLVQLALGDFKNGWNQYEVRFDPSRIATDRVVMPTSRCPQLLKEHSAKGKTIVLLQEQGFGDTFQFYRFAKQLKDEGAKRILAITSKELISEVKTLPWIDEVYFELKDHQAQIDYWVYPMSLPARYEIDEPNKVPCPIPYLGVYQEKYAYWHEQLKHVDAKKLRVGLVWAGRETHTNDKNRSMRLEQFQSFKKFSNDVEFISLQKGARELDEVSNGWYVEKLGSKIQDFSDSAGLLANLDLLISIDSAPVHLAGALGMPVWTLIPKMFDFRWMIDRTDTPWYPSMKLFRQKELKNWTPVIAELEQALEQWIASKPSRWRPKLLNINGDLLQSPRAGTELMLHAGFSYHQKGQLQEAAQLYEEVRQYHPQNNDAVRNMAVIYRVVNQIPKALELYEYGARCEFRDSVFFSNYANLLNQLGRDRDALLIANKALEIDPNNCHAIGLRANYLFEARLWEQALDEIRRAIAIEERPEFLMRATLTYLELKRIGDAKTTLERLDHLTGKTLQYHMLAGQLYKDAQDYALAMGHYDAAILIDPSNYETYMNRAVLKAHIQDYAGAEQDARISIGLDDQNAESHFNLAVYLLTQGKFEEGWKEFEWRMDHRRTAQERVRMPVLSMPMWRGESLEGKTILIMPEQGYGDYIQFIRYSQWLKSLGAKVVVAANPALEKIIPTCPWIDEIVLDGQQVTYHYWVFPMSLPFLAGTLLETIPANTPYLSAPKDKKSFWQEKLEAAGLKKGKKPIIALCWQGAAIHRFDHRRSIPLEAFAPLMALPDFQFIGLVKEDGIAPSFTIDNEQLVNLGADIADFSDTAGILSQVDLLISIDSAPVHLAGALDVPCWVLLDSMFDYRWLIDREDSPWYPSITVIRKKLGEDWSAVILGVKKRLVVWAEKKTQKSNE